MIDDQFLDFLDAPRIDGVWRTMYGECMVMASGKML